MAFRGSPVRSRSAPPTSLRPLRLDFALRAHQLQGFAPAARASSPLGDFARREPNDDFGLKAGTLLSSKTRLVVEVASGRSALAPTRREPYNSRHISPSREEPYEESRRLRVRSCPRVHRRRRTARGEEGRAPRQGGEGRREAREAERALL